MSSDPFNNHILMVGESESGGQKEKRRSAARRREGSDDAGYVHVVAVALLSFMANTMIMAAVDVIVSVIYSAVQAKAKADEREKIEKLKKKKNLKGLMKVHWVVVCVAVAAAAAGIVMLMTHVAHSVPGRPNCNSLQLSVAAFQLPATMHETRCRIKWGNTLDKRQ
jgi:hypothetical protein